MRNILSFTSVLVVCCLLLLVFQAIAQDKAEEEMKKEMEMWAKFAEPGIHHQHLKQLEGTWDVKVKSWNVPDAPPMESTGIAEFTMILGGRYLSMKAKSEFAGQPFEGFGVLAYDNVKKEYESFWMDTMMTGFMTSKGKCEDNGKKWVMTSEMFNVAKDKTEKYKTIGKLIDKDTYEEEMYQVTPDGKEVKMMEFHYARKK
ncbi:MAG: hypothetical protein A2Y62_18010 [Candidatus Fischerbacteria bacterium RBG_13_37_8]|uniref:DUF1579 domain-containing protein n=1 Tax=Candidatus Fischerbacteria bacterium RBG_13_37_8 TaxID=1817863 RepID=A0A1F5VWF8_9BACT|nr:MAG: hypothetical protein A2Y62_18010 [Candidatus Fischerbacteria bacterium RBG_13_37_8]